MRDSAIQLETQQELLQEAVDVLNNGGVIAYPTEYCFGLGCNPKDEQAVQRILDIKQRSVEQGLILIAATVEQVEEYADVQSSAHVDEILASWPGANTWLLEKRKTVPAWVSGKHDSIAMRVTNHSFSQALCENFSGAIVSTSANRHGLPALLTADQVELEMGKKTGKEIGEEIDYIVQSPVGGAAQPSLIRDGKTGEKIR